MAPMYIETVPNRNSPPALLLREGWREGKKTVKRTLANLSDWPPAQIASLRRVLRGETLVSPQDLLTTTHTSPHGHVEALLAMIRELDLPAVIASKRCRERDLVVAMIVQRLIDPCSKLATTRAWHTTTLAEELGVARSDRGRTLRRHGLAVGTPGAHREEAGRASSPRGRLGALRCDQQFL